MFNSKINIIKFNNENVNLAVFKINKSKAHSKDGFNDQIFKF